MKNEIDLHLHCHRRAFVEVFDEEMDPFGQFLQLRNFERKTHEFLIN